jgi:hypothetical protein
MDEQSQRYDEAIRNVSNVPKKCTVVISVGAQVETLLDAGLAMPVLNQATCHDSVCSEVTSRHILNLRTRWS